MPLRACPAYERRRTEAEIKGHYANAGDEKESTKFESLALPTHFTSTRLVPAAAASMGSEHAVTQRQGVAFAASTDLRHHPSGGSARLRG